MGTNTVEHVNEYELDKDKSFRFRADTPEPECNQCGCTHATAYELGRADGQLALVTAAKAALKYVDNLDENTPVDQNCPECMDGVFYTPNKGPQPAVCWIHLLEKAVKGTGTSPLEAERDALKKEVEGLKRHIKDLNSDLEGMAKDLLNQCCEGCQ